MPWVLILVVAAFVCALIACAFPNPDPWPWRIRLLCASLACFFLAQIVLIAGRPNG